MDECRRVLNNVVHVNAFFRRHPPKRVTVPLPTVAEAEEVVNIAEMVREESRLSQ